MRAIIYMFFVFSIIFLIGCPAFSGTDEGTKDGEPVVIDPIDSGCDPNYYEASECSQACVFKAGFCAISGFGSRCYIYSCNVSSTCNYTCTGSCGYIDSLHPEGCNPLPPQ